MFNNDCLIESLMKLYNATREEVEQSLDPGYTGLTIFEKHLLDNVVEWKAPGFEEKEEYGHS